MKASLKYRDYIGSVKFSDDDGIYYGTVEGIGDAITFQGTSVAVLERDFHSAVDDYLETSKRLGRT